MFLKILLYPFSLVYGLVTGLRNHMYDKGLKPSASFDLPVISVGNLTVGGTGKTPMVEYLIRLLKPTYKIATLSRGYGRSTKGFRIASTQDSATTIGDEPFQFYQKFQPEVVVAVGEERAFAIPLILQEAEDLDVIILDDAFQHRRVKPSLNVLLSDYNRPFYKDLILPSGRLRESRAGASRADMIIVSKCPGNISEHEFKIIRKAVAEYGKAPVFFTTLVYGEPMSFGQSRPLTKSVILVTGIANPEPLKKYVSEKYEIATHLEYSDHKHYEASDLEKISGAVRQFPDAVVITTEKDMVKLNDPAFSEYVTQIPFYYIPITVQFLKEGSEFDRRILTHIGERD